MDTAALDPYSSTRTLSGGSFVDGTSIPYLIVANGLLVALVGVFALSSPGERRAIASTTTVNIAATTQLALQTIMWSCVALAALAFVPWLDAHTFGITTSEAPVVMTALADAMLFASVALACAFFASQMRRGPSELVWAALVIAGGVMFVIAGSEIAETTHGCTSNGTILGFMGGGFVCFSSTNEYELSAGTAVGWFALIGSAVCALLEIALPTIESIGRANETLERSEQW